VAQVTLNTSGLFPFPSGAQQTDVQGGVVDEVQTVSLASVTRGSFKLKFATEETAAIAFNAAAAAVETALEALAGIDNVAVSGSAGGPWTITFLGSLAGQNVPPLGVNSTGLTNANPLSLTTYAYDAASRLLSTTDPLGFTTAYEYDNLDNLTKITQPDPDGAGSLTSPLTTFAYDAVSNQLSLTDPVGNTTEWAYDNLDRVISETNELAKTRTFKYDAVNNLIERIDRLGRKTVWDYDNLYRNTAEKWYDGSTLVRTLSFTYDAASQLTAASDPAASYTFTLDNLGRVTTESQSLSGLTPELQYVSQFDAASRRTQLQAKIGGTNDFKNDFTYDNLNRLTRLQQQDVGGGHVVADKRIDFAYDAASSLTKLDRYADQSATEHVASTHYTYDGLGRLKKLLHTEGPTAPGSGWGTDALAGYAFTYDTASRITSIDSFVDGLTTYTHDNTDQLTAADHTGQTDEAYSFDRNGNRTMTGYTTGTNNQLTSDGTNNYTYDDEGNRLTKTKISTGEKEENTWDHRNRLTKVNFKNSGGTVVKSVDFIYDAFCKNMDDVMKDSTPGTNQSLNRLDPKIRPDTQRSSTTGKTTTAIAPKSRVKRGGFFRLPFGKPTGGTGPIRAAGPAAAAAGAARGFTHTASLVATRVATDESTDLNKALKMIGLLRRINKEQCEQQPSYSKYLDELEKYWNNRSNKMYFPDHDVWGNPKPWPDIQMPRPPEN
jgi:YD repeat-containing protein